MDPEPPTITETDGRAHVDKLIELLGTGAPRWLDNRLAEWRAADLDFQRHGYGATTRAPKHPLIAPIGEYRRWGLGTMPRDEVVQLMEAAAAVTGFEMDWRGHEPWLAARLRDENGCRQALFELRTGLYFQALGHRVQYLSPQQLPGPDLSVEQVGTDVLIECVQMDASSGHQIPQTAAHEIGRQLVRFMHRSGHNRLVGLRCKKRLDPADTDVIVREIKGIIARSTTGVFEIFNGKYRIELMYGGSQIAPLDFAGAARANRWLNAVPFRVGDVRGLDRGVHPPSGRFIARGVNVASDELDSALQRLCDAAIAKADQLRIGSPGIIVAEFGMPLTDEQARWDRLQAALSYHITSRFVRHPEISAVAFLFPTELRRSSVASGVGAVLTPVEVIHWFENPTASSPLPPDFRWSVHKTDVIASSG